MGWSINEYNGKRKYKDIEMTKEDVLDEIVELYTNSKDIVSLVEQIDDIDRDNYVLISIDKLKEMQARIQLCDECEHRKPFPEKLYGYCAIDD